MIKQYNVQNRDKRHLDTVYNVMNILDTCVNLRTRLCLLKMTPAKTIIIFLQKWCPKTINRNIVEIKSRHLQMDGSVKNNSLEENNHRCISHSTVQHCPLLLARD